MDQGSREHRKGYDPGPNCKVQLLREAHLPLTLQKKNEYRMSVEINKYMYKMHKTMYVV